MAARKRVADNYVNRAYVSVVESAANTLTFSQIRWAVGTFEGIAVKLSRVEWYFNSTLARGLVAATDSVQVALTGRDDLTTLDPTNQSIYVKDQIICIAANVEPVVSPIIHDFSNLPMNGLLLPANPMFLGAMSEGAAQANTFRGILYYTFIHLSDREALEVLQTILPGNV